MKKNTIDVTTTPISTNNISLIMAGGGLNAVRLVPQVHYRPLHLDNFLLVGDTLESFFTVFLSEYLEGNPDMPISFCEEFVFCFVHLIHPLPLSM